MAHATMSGYLSLGLLVAPVKVYKATEDEKSSFHLVHAVCKSRINMKTWCPVCDKAIDRDECTKGFQESKDGPLTIIDPEAIKSQKIADEKIDVIEFVPPAAIDARRYTGALYFLGCDKKAPRDQYRLIFAALAEEDKLALAKVRMYGRERIALIKADRDAGCFTLAPLYYDAELRGADEIPRPEDKPIDPAHMTLARKLIAGMTVPKLDLSNYRDEYEERLVKLIAEAQAGGAQVVQPAPQTSGVVVDLMAALKASLEKTPAAAAVAAQMETPKSKGKGGKKTAAA